MKKEMLPPLLAGLLLTGCATFSVRYDYDARIDCSAYRTFDWYASSRLSKDQAQKVEDPIMDRRVAETLERELAARGFRRETGTDPDFLVAYYPVYREKKYRTGEQIGFGSWGFHPFGIGIGTGLSQEHRYKEGTLVLEVVDARTSQRVWQASAEGALTNLKDPGQADRQVTLAVHKMLERFPPKKP